MVYGLTPDSGLYELVVFLHILTAIVGFGSTFVWPLLSTKARKSGDPGLMLRVSEMIDEAGHVLSSPFIWASGAFGLLAVILASSADNPWWEFSDLWISIAMTLYLVALGVSIGLHYPNLRRMLALQREMAAAGPPQGGPPPQVAELEARGKKAAMFGGILHLLFVLILLDMVFKPM